MFDSILSCLNYLFSAKRKLFQNIYQITGFHPTKITCYEQALRHHSVSEKIHQSGTKNSNERLEYLGDAILNGVIADYLFKKFPFKEEGFLTEMRSKIVSRASLNDLALKIGLSKLVEYDKRSMQNVNLRNSIFGNALEAFIGAIFLDKGFDKTRWFITEKLIRFHIDVDKLKETETNFKGRLIEYSQKLDKPVEFEVLEEVINKQKIYTARILIGRVVFGEAKHTNKKQAEQMAAQKTMDELKNKGEEISNGF